MMFLEFLKIWHGFAQLFYSISIFGAAFAMLILGTLNSKNVLVSGLLLTPKKGWDVRGCNSYQVINLLYEIPWFFVQLSQVACCFRRLSVMLC